MSLEIVLAGVVAVGIAVWSKLDERREELRVQARVRRTESREGLPAMRSGL